MMKKDTILFMNKKEIYDIKENDEKELLQKKWTMLRHQKIISIFMSSYNLNRGILLFHEMGSGKSLASISIAERIRKEKNNINKCFYFAKNKNLLEDFMEKIYNLLGDDRSKKEIDNFYKIKTNKIYNTFKKSFVSIREKNNETIRTKRYTDDKIKEIFSNSVVIIDEAII